MAARPLSTATRSRPGAPTVVVSGTIAGVPHQGGATWAVLQYVLGLRRLGWDVWFAEPLTSKLPVDGVEYVRSVAQRFGLDDRWAVVTSGGTAGSSDAIAAVAAADLLLDVSGMALATEPLRSLALDVPVRVFLDLDPAFVQFWAASGEPSLRLDDHTHHVSLSDSIGGDGPIPDSGKQWIPTLPPVVLEHWPVSAEQVEPTLTTVGHWRSYGGIHLDGIRYGVKAHSTRQLASLPHLAGVPIRPAFAIHPDERDDLRMLEQHGWEIVDPAAVAGDPDRYAEYVRHAWAEIGIAKEGYVVADTGWFSDRSACFLAAGRPVVAQGTGFDRRLPTGAGLLRFDDVGSAAEAIHHLRGDYDSHRRAARRVAEEFLDSDRVLSSLVDAVT